MRVHIPANYPPESLVLFVMSTWHVLLALLISRAGVLRREPASAAAALAAGTEPSSLPAPVAQPAMLQEQNA